MGGYHHAQAALLPRKESLHSLSERLKISQSRSGHGGEEKILHTHRELYLNSPVVLPVT
jgi:hypothetical protein